MKWRVEGSPSYSLLIIELNPGEAVTAEAGALVYARGDYEVKTHTGGGIFKALRRAALGGESLFLNTYVARGPTELGFAPGLPGDIAHIRLNGDTWILQDDAFLAYIGDIDLDSAWRGVRGLLAEGELFWLKASGVGDLWVSSYGAIKRIDLGPGEKATIDNQHLVAMPANTNFRIRKFGGWKTFLLGGEGLVVEVEGPTTVYIQTRILPPFAQLVAKLIRK